MKWFDILAFSFNQMRRGRVFLFLSILYFFIFVLLLVLIFATQIGISILACSLSYSLVIFGIIVFFSIMMYVIGLIVVFLSTSKTEFKIIRQLGASNSDINRIIFTQIVAILFLGALIEFIFVDLFLKYI